MKKYEIGDRIRLLMGNDSPSDFSEKVGVTERTLHNYLSGQMPRFTTRAKICEAYGINPMWLFRGDGPMYSDGQKADLSVIKTGGASCSDAAIGNDGMADLSVTPPDGIQPIFIPKVQARLSAGTGSLEVDASVDGFFAFRSDWIRKKGCPNQMVLMTVTGDSMSPTIQNGDMVLINQGQREVIAGAIYAIGVDDSVLVKRLDKRPGKIVLVSDNRDAYAPQELDMTDEIVRDSLRVIGRVLWWCREA